MPGRSTNSHPLSFAILLPGGILFESATRSPRCRSGFFFQQAPVIQNVSVRMVRESHGAPHRSHQRIRTCSAGEDPAMLAESHGVRRSQISGRSQHRGPVEEDIRITRVRTGYTHRVHSVPVNRAGRSISPL